MERCVAGAVCSVEHQCSSLKVDSANRHISKGPCARVLLKDTGPIVRVYDLGDGISSRCTLEVKNRVIPAGTTNSNFSQRHASGVGVQPQLIVGSAAEIKRRAAGYARPDGGLHLFHGDLIGGSAEIEAIFLGAITDEVVVYPIDQDLAEGDIGIKGDRASRCSEDRLVGGSVGPDNLAGKANIPVGI